jgi:hypothetical protein
VRKAIVLCHVLGCAAEDDRCSREGKQARDESNHLGVRETEPRVHGTNRAIEPVKSSHQSIVTAVLKIAIRDPPDVDLHWVNYGP